MWKRGGMKDRKEGTHWEKRRYERYERGYTLGKRGGEGTHCGKEEERVHIVEKRRYERYEREYTLWKRGGMKDKR